MCFGRLALLASVLTAGSGSLSPAATPNFVVVFIDDMGYGDIEPFGSTINRTPHLSQMADEGCKLTSFYVACAVCTPSRAALLTGCYPMRVGLATGSAHVVLFPGDVHGLNPDELTIAEILKTRGYKTGCFGKWHLGDQPQFMPTAQGFDHYFGIPYSNDMWPPLLTFDCPRLPIVRNGRVVDEVVDMEDQASLCRRFTEEAQAFIHRHKDEPFFVYLPHAFVHHPRAGRTEFAGGVPPNDFSAFEHDERMRQRTKAQIEEIDWSVGQILQTLRDLELDENTFVIFTSDNGGARGCVNAPLRGGKGSQFEGGMREPTIAWWPGTIPAGSVSDELLTTMDLLPTFAELAGAEVPQDRVIDGHSIASVLKGEPGAKSRRDYFFYYGKKNLRAVRGKRFKLFANGELYDLVNDISESTDVANKHPDVVQRLTAALDVARRDLGDGEQLGENVRPVGIAINTRTILPRKGITGEAGYVPTLTLPRPNRRQKLEALKTKPVDKARQRVSDTFPPVPDDRVARYTAPRASGPIQIDGKLDEATWKSISKSPRFVDLVSGQRTLYDTRAAVTWDDENLYVAYWVEEPFVTATFLERDQPIYRDNDVEFFVAGKDGYYEFEVNALGTIYEGFFIWQDVYDIAGYATMPEFDPSHPGVKRQPFNGVGLKDHPRGKRFAFLKWDFPGVKVGVHVDGTLNDNSDRDRGWTVEVAFPWSGMQRLALADGRALPPKKGDVWRMDFSRFNQFREAAPARDSGGWAWSAHGVWDSHVPEVFPYVVFGGVAFRISNDSMAGLCFLRCDESSCLRTL